MNDIGSQNWYDYSVSQCELLKEAFTDKGYTVFLGECSCEYPKERFSANAVYTEQSECVKIILEMLVDYDIVPVLWTVDGACYSRTDCSVIDEKDAEVILYISEMINQKKAN